MPKERIERDFYPSPEWSYKALFEHLYVFGSDVLLEPARGDGRIIEAMPQHHEIKWAELAEGRDYLAPKLDYSADVIVTNPPFSHALEFIRTALQRDLKDKGTCCMLLRMSMLGSKERADFWREFAPTHLLMLTPRPSFVYGGSDNSEYAWFVWDFGGRVDLPSIWTLKREEVDAEYRQQLERKQEQALFKRLKQRMALRHPDLSAKALNDKTRKALEVAKARKTETIL